MASQPHDDEDNGFDQALHDAGIGHLATPGSASKKKLTQILRGLLSEVNKLTEPQLNTLENKLLPDNDEGPSSKSISKQPAVKQPAPSVAKTEEPKLSPEEAYHRASTQILMEEAQAAHQAGVPIPKEIQAEIDEAMAEAAPQNMGKSKILDSLRALVRPAAQAVVSTPAASPSPAPAPAAQTPAMPIKQMPLLQPPPKPLDGDNHNPYEGL